LENIGVTVLLATQRRKVKWWVELADLDNSSLHYMDGSLSFNAQTATVIIWTSLPYFHYARHMWAGLDNCLAFCSLEDNNSLTLLLCTKKSEEPVLQATVRLKRNKLFQTRSSFVI
jgi:hypothetical protein